ncbi:MAG TPA: Uma2 family endonuclease [Acetobacteraceae bacterium]|nr:Uma2 family endonuclease [Acetobacteraceae bacterium]
MSDVARKQMTSDGFIAWAMAQPEMCHYELIGGEIVSIAPERSAHALTKFHIARQLAAQVEAARRPCQVYPDGMAVAVDDLRVYEPDALVRCGDLLPSDPVKLSDPVIIVEVQSPSASSRDVGPKPMGYFRLPSLTRYLIFRMENRTITQHSRGEDDLMLTRIVRDGPIVLDPPGITLADCFPTGAA